MLKGIPSILGPDLLKILADMGHGDELLIADGNYPKFGQPEISVRLDGQGTLEVLSAILQFMPLDEYVEKPVIFMDVLSDDPYVPTIWNDYKSIMNESNLENIGILKINKEEFYARGKKTYAVIKTSEKALYANLILKKGVVK